MGNIKELLDQQYNILEETDYSVKNKVNIINNIIEIKLDNHDIQNYSQSLTRDIKYLFSQLIRLEENTSVGYDEIRVNRVKEILTLIPHPTRISLLDYFIRILRVGFYDEKIRQVEQLKYNFEVENCISNPLNVKNIYKLLVNLPFRNTYNLLASFILVFVIFYIFTLPALHPILELFRLDYFQYSDNFYLNHFYNTISYLIGLNQSMEIICLSGFAVVVAATVKITFIVLVLNSLLAKLLDLTKK